VPSTAIAIIKTMSIMDTESEAISPWSLAGQKAGAILAVRRNVDEIGWESSLKVGDLVTVQDHQVPTCVVHSQRLNADVKVPWSIFVPLKVGTKCCYPWGDCRCEITNPKKCSVRTCSLVVGDF
jgi:hypothetical protein